MYRATFKISTKTSLFPVAQIRNRCAQRKKNPIDCSKRYFFRVQGGCFWSPPSCRETELQRPPIYRHCSTAPSTNLFSVNSFVHSAWKNITWDLQFIPKMHQWRKYRKKLAPRRVCFTWKGFHQYVRTNHSPTHFGISPLPENEKSRV